jgi:uncharacterized protein DUF4352
MPDYSSYGVPRPVEVGREVRLEQRRSANSAAIFAIGGVLVLCICMVVGIVAAVFFLGSTQSGGKPSAISLPFSSGATPTPTETGKPTPVPFLKSVKDGAGLRLTVTAYQRPLPAQDIKVPDGQELALVTLRLDNTRTTGGPIKYDSQDFALVSAEGDHFTPDNGGITTGSMLKKGEIEPGKSVTGDLVFYVYTDVKDLMLAWTSADGTTRVFKLTRQ